MHDDSKWTNPPFDEQKALQDGTLMTALQRATSHGKTTGALTPLQTRREALTNQEIPFHLYILEETQRQLTDEAMGQLARQKKKKNPFLPYEKDLFVADLNPNYLLILNKFSIFDHHALLITREFQSQKEGLYEEEFHIMARLLKEKEGLFFYNADTTAGASQPHKHLQFIPTLTNRPLSDIAPLNSLFQQFRTSSITQIPLFNFLHFWQPLTLSFNPKILFRRYRQQLQQWKQNIAPNDNSNIPLSHNILMTPHWFLLIPRRQEFFHSVSINALGFVGNFLVRDEQERQLFLDHPLFEILKEISYQKD